MGFLFEGSAFYATLQCYNIFKNYSNYVLRERWHDVDGGRLAVSGRRGGGLIVAMVVGGGWRRERVDAEQVNVLATGVYGATWLAVHYNMNVDICSFKCFLNLSLKQL